MPPATIASVNNRTHPSTLIGWGLAVAAVVLGHVLYGGAGVMLALSIVVFWLLLQFSRTLRLMRRAAAQPVGHVESAVMLHAKLKPGLRLMDIIGLTGSLGRRLPHPSPGADESWEWRDAGDDTLVVDLVGGRCVGSSVARAASTAGQATAEPDTDSPSAIPGPRIEG